MAEFKIRDSSGGVVFSVVRRRRGSFIIISAEGVKLAFDMRDGEIFLDLKQGQFASNEVVLLPKESLVVRTYTDKDVVDELQRELKRKREQIKEKKKKK